MTSKNSIHFSSKAIVFITGASRGIGRTIAVEISRKLEQNSIMVLLARSTTGLEETKSQIGEIDKSIAVEIFSVDLSKPDINEYNNVFNKVLNSVDTKDIKTGIFFHNPGRIGVPENTTDPKYIQAWREYYDLNMFTCVSLNNLFIRHMRPVAPKLCVINISSMAGTLPIQSPYLGMYGTGKYIREKYFRVFALVERDITVFNYRPGIDVEDLLKDIINSDVLTPTKTVNKLLDIIKKGNFSSGDYFDDI